MKISRQFLIVFLLFGLSLAQNPNLPAPSGPVLEVRSSGLNAALRVSGCFREGQGVVCNVVFRNISPSDQSYSFPHNITRLIGPNGTAYAGYLSLEGSEVGAERTNLTLGANKSANGRAIFPSVAGEVSFIPFMEVGGLEFRGLGISAAQLATTKTEATVSSIKFSVDRCSISNNQVVCQIIATNTTQANKDLGLYRPLNAADSADFGKIFDSAGAQYRLVGAGFGNLEGQVFQTLPAGVPTRFEVAYNGQPKGREITLLIFATNVGEVKFQKVPIR